MIPQSSNSYIDWFDVICTLLRKNNHPTTRKLEHLIGTLDEKISSELRGSKFLIPSDTRFSWACINPDIDSQENDKPINYFAISSKELAITMNDLIKRFSEFRITRNVYDGGSQIFFYPIDEKFEFRGLAFLSEKEPEHIDLDKLRFQTISFIFGETIFQARDGYHLRR